MHNLLRNIFLLKGHYWSETIIFLVFLHLYTKTRDKDVTHIRIRKQKYNNQELKLTCHVISPHNGEGFGFPTAYGLTQIFFFSFFFNISLDRRGNNASEASRVPSLAMVVKPCNIAG